jgi:hypothetical protein
MQNPEKPEGNEALSTWIEEKMKTAVHFAGNSGFIDGLLIEARPEWVFPFGFLLASARDQSLPQNAFWIICAEGKVDGIPAQSAQNPKAAARHFALKWQLEASRSDTQQAELIELAEALFILTDDPALWADET